MKVSVVIPFFRYDWELGAALDSVLKQSIEDYEIVLVDNNASTNARAVAERYLQTHPKRVRIVTETEQGNASARNAGLSATVGEFVAFLDSDDMMAPDRLAKQLAALEEKPNAVLAYSPIACCNYLGTEIVEASRIPRTPPWATYLRVPYREPDATAIMVRRESAFRAGLFDTRFNPFWQEDSDFCLRMFVTGPFVFLPDPLTIQRRHSDDELRWRDKSDYGWHAVRNAGLFFTKLKALYYRAGDRDNEKAFRRIRAEELRGIARSLFRLHDGVELGRRLFADALMTYPQDYKNWKQFARSRLPFPVCSRLLKQQIGEGELPSWLTPDYIREFFCL